MSEPAIPQSRKARPGLGRGLSALLGDAVSEAPVGEGAARPSGVTLLPTGSLAPHPGQPRRHFDEDALDELAASIKSRGLLQPILVRPLGKGFQIVAGERRWRAAQRARLHEVPVIVRELDDAETLEIALVENIQRKDLNAIEEAEAYRKLIDEFGHTQEALAKIVHKSRSHVANLMRLLDLPERVRAMLAVGAIEMGQARALINVPGAEALAERVAAQGLSVRETEKLARDARPRRSAGQAGPPARGDADITALETHLGDALGLKIRIVHGEKGGSVTVSYATLDQLDMICQRLTGERI